MRFTSIKSLIFILLIGPLISACGAWQAASDTTVSAAKAIFNKQVKVLNVDFKARDALNTSENKKSLSVVVRVYQLKDRKAFDAATYNDLLTNDKIILAQDMLGTHGAVVNPGAAASLSQPMDDRTKFVATVVFFREATMDENWRRVVERKMLSADRALKYALMDNKLIGVNDSPNEYSE